MKILFAAILAVALSPSLFSQSIMSCPAGKEDMLNYFTMTDPDRLSNFMAPGNANPIYTTLFPDLGTSFAVSGYFLWTKSWVGYPWDVKGFDANYIYDRSTELLWTDPTTFRRFTTDLPISARCVRAGRPGPTIKIPSSVTNYGSYSNCQLTQTQNLGYVVNSISAPVAVNTSGNLGTVTTRYFTYKYSCDASYAHCAYKEVFSLGLLVGLYDWQYYTRQGSKFVLTQESMINQFTPGTATPYLPCTNTYE